MGLFDKLKKPKDPQRAKGAAMLFCPEPDPRKALEIGRASCRERVCRYV